MVAVLTPRVLLYFARVSPSTYASVHYNLPLRMRRKAIFKLQKRWFLGQRLLAAGQHQNGMAELCEAVESAAALGNSDPAERVPPQIMSPIWASQFGHLGLLALYAKAQESGIVPVGRRTVLVEKVGHAELLKGLESKFDFRAIGEKPIARCLIEDAIPISWPHIEQIEVVRNSSGGLTDIFTLWEQVWSPYTDSPSSSSFDFRFEYLGKSREMLGKLGLDPEKPYVTILIRDKFHSPSDHRSASLENYRSSVNFLWEAGYQVVRIGANWMRPLPADFQVLDLVRVGPKDSYMDPYVLANASFVISTLSGPASVASMLGTPVLWTNVTQIGKSTPSGPSESRFLPKRHFLGKNHEMSLREILQSPVGYWLGPEYMLSSISSLDGYNVRENSPDEILAATKEMIGLSSRESSTASELQKRASVVRSECSAISQGTFASSFLGSSPGWLD